VPLGGRGEGGKEIEGKTRRKRNEDRGGVGEERKEGARGKKRERKRKQREERRGEERGGDWR